MAEMKLKKNLYKLWSKFLTMFGNIKVFRWPMWLVYDPDDYQISGKDMQDILHILKPGDIVLRGYNRYLDGKFIPNYKNDVIGKGFSHGAIYVGDDTIVHAIAEGVQEINVLDFLQCDRIAVFRPISGARNAVKTAKKFVENDIPYDFSFDVGASALYCFELCAECYKELDIKQMTVSKLFGLMKKDVYIAQSFVESEDLDLVYCKNPKSKILFAK